MLAGCEVKSIEDVVVKLREIVDEVEARIDVEDVIEASVDETDEVPSPTVVDVDDCVSDEAVTVELVTLLSTHGCFTTSSRRILHAVSQDSQSFMRKSQKRMSVLLIRTYCLAPADLPLRSLLTIADLRKEVIFAL